LSFRRSTAGSRRATNELMAPPALRLRIISAGCEGTPAPVCGWAVRVVDARVRCGMAIVGARSAALGRGRAITAGAAIGVDGAIASNGGTSVRAVVGSRAAAKAGRLRRALRVGESLVVRTPAGPDYALLWEATAVRSVTALRVRRAGAHAVDAGRSYSGRVRLAGRSRTPLHGAARSRGPMVEWNLRVARGGRSRFDEGRLTGDGSGCVG
jgi:hypothetical protein